MYLLGHQLYQNTHPLATTANSLGEWNHFMRCGYATCLFPLCLLATGLASGCQTAQLRQGSINQAASYGDLQEQQVLDNLAKFAYDINSFPSFAYSAQGTNQVQDTLSIMSTSSWQRIAGGVYGWMSSTAVPSAARQGTQSWILQPLNDPRKLDLMRCAYQQVVRANLAACGSPIAGTPATCGGGNCPDCSKRLNSFYTGKADTPPPLPGDPKDAGRVTNLCLGNNPAWFASGCKKDLPKACRCLKYGHYCGVYVWVLPGGEDELAKLTLAILDYAVNAPADASKPASKQVAYFVDATGKQTTQANAVGVVSGTVPANKPSISILKADLPKTIKILEDKLAATTSAHAEYMKGKNPEAFAADPTAKRLKADIETYTQDIKTLKLHGVGLEELPDQPAPYRPSIDETSGPNLLQIQSRLQSTQPVPTVFPTP
ncbi:hypothetical protein [Fimbriiglobus ruber]|uniref:Uncharacterized protein n=1 Tax=Fimbriiglobus ruber TaxID=1908690 RepID=A0A225E8X7_9BACT|nr:hypothetical protein [Fimbriiglobus ruber]OWK45065.1 hypothetical protein FRUB_01396 [Fimbriiglobus ruber]